MTSSARTTQTVKLLPPGVDKQYISKDQFSTLPQEIQPLITSYSHGWKVTVTPHKTPNSGLCRVHIVSGSSMTSTSLFVENQGRIGAEPAPNQDDLRPCVYLVFGVGKADISGYFEYDELCGDCCHF